MNFEPHIFSTLAQLIKVAHPQGVQTMIFNMTNNIKINNFKWKEVHVYIMIVDFIMKLVTSNLLHW